MNNSTITPQNNPQGQIAFTWGLSTAITVAIIIINSLTIYVIRTVDTLKEKYGILLMAYCAVDIINGFHVTYLQFRIWLLVNSYNPTCKWREILVYNFDSLPYTVSSWHTVLLTFDRYIAVCYPLQYHRIMFRQRQKALVAVIWLVATLENIAPWLYFKAFKCDDMVWKGPVDLDSRFQFSHITLIFILHFIMYSRIWWIAYKMRKRSVEAFSDDVTPARPRILDKATMTVFCVVVLSYVIWMPYMMYRFLTQFLQPNQLMFRLTILLGFCGSFVNNIIYVIINGSFRDGFKRLACKRNDI